MTDKSKTVHFVMQGKGGVGKSLVSRLLAEHLIGLDVAFLNFDADPINRTFASVTAYRAKPLDLLDGNGQVHARKFDSLIEDIMGAETPSVVVDTGASSFLPMIGYLDDADIIAVLGNAGYQVAIHTVVTGGSSYADTLAGMTDLGERFGENAAVYVWLNEYFGSLTDGDAAFTATRDFKALEKAGVLAGVIVVPRFSQLLQEDFDEFLAANISFEEAVNGDRMGVMPRARIRKIQRDLLDGIATAFEPESDAA